MSTQFRCFISISILCLILLVPDGSGRADQIAKPPVPPAISDQLTISSFVNHPTVAGDEYWNDVFYPPGTNFRVNAVTTSRNDLYNGGIFSFIGNTPAHFVVWWDGSDWYSLANDFVWPIAALVVDNNHNLYAATYDSIYQWDAAAWHTLSRGIEISAFAVDDGGNLYAGRHFTTAGSVTASNIAWWDRKDGSALVGGGQGVMGEIFALISDNQSNLYAAGKFNAAGDVCANNIAMWDGSAWQPLGGGVSWTVHALAMDNYDNL